VTPTAAQHQKRHGDAAAAWRCGIGSLRLRQSGATHHGLMTYEQKRRLKALPGGGIAKNRAASAASKASEWRSA
jgi:hypothetical protein